MKLAYLDCFSGVSGDMLIGALLDAGLDLDDLRNALSGLDLAGYRLESKKVTKQHLACTKFDVIVEESQPLRHLADLNAAVDKAGLDEDVTERAKAVFLKIGEAEAAVHGKSLDSVHFHEVGAVDTVIDVVGVLVGLKLLGVEKVVASPLNLGTGTVTFSHGRWPVPAPASAEILKGKPVYATDSQAELLTPTGAALVAVICDAFGPPPMMTLNAIGYGAGERDLDTPNALRVLIGEGAGGDEQDEIAVIETDIDDMNPELYEAVMEALFEDGALDVSFTSVMMKKNRPGTRVTVLAPVVREHELAQRLLQESTTLGVRMRRERRKVLPRRFDDCETSYGPLRVKVMLLRDGVERRCPEYDDCKAIARREGIPVRDVYERLMRDLNADH